MLTIKRLGRRSFEVFRLGSPVGIVRFLRDSKMWTFRPYPTPDGPNGLIEKSDKEHSKKIREECIYKIFKDIVKKDQIKENKPKTKSGLSYTLWKEDELDYENYGNKLTPEIVLTLAQKLNNFISELESNEVQFR